MAVAISLMTTSCFLFPKDISGETFITNMTGDTLVLVDMESGIPGRNVTLLPNSTTRYLYGQGKDASVLTVMDQYPKVYANDTVRIYRGDSLLVEWCPPLRSMAKDSNSFFNRNSWTITPRTDDDDYLNSTLVITEEDYGARF